MLKRRAGLTGKMRESSAPAEAAAAAAVNQVSEWEMRPGGMLVQKRIGGSGIAPPSLRIRVVYNAIRYEIWVNAQATFGELKKLLTAETGLQPDEQRVVFRGKDRHNGEYLDMCGVRDKSKVILTEDASSRERKYIEKRRNAKLQSIHRAISDVSMEIDRLAEQVDAIEKSISNGTKVPELQITTITELLMRQALKLDSISPEGDAVSQKTVQGKRVQRCVETLDVLKISNARLKPAIVTTTKWETFDPPPSTEKWEFFD